MPISGPIPEQILTLIAAATVFAYLVFSALTLIPYVVWRRRWGSGAGSADPAEPPPS